MIDPKYMKSLLESAQQEWREKGNGEPLKKFWTKEIKENFAACSPRQKSIRTIFEHFIDGGPQILKSWASHDPTDPNRGVSLARLEATGAIDTSSFSRISQMLIDSAIMEGYEQPGFIGDRLVETIPTTKLDGQSMAGVGALGDITEDVGEGMPYPTAGLAEEWVETPATVKGGAIVNITKEAVIKDETGEVLKKARNLGEAIGLRKEKRILDMVCGISTLYRYKSGALASTYATSGSYINQITDVLVDYTDIIAAEAKFQAMTNPTTGEPIFIKVNQLLVPHVLVRTAQRILNTLEYRQVTQTNYTAVYQNPLNTDSPVPGVTTQIELISSQYVKQRTNSDIIWFCGDFPKAFAYMEVWGPQTDAQGPSSEVEFTMDIIERYKVSERGTPAVKDPRYALKSTGAG